MKMMMMVAVLVLLVVPVAAQVKWTTLGPKTMMLPSVTCPSPSTSSFAVELRRIIKAQEQKLKVLRELLVELEKDQAGANTLTFGTGDCVYCTTGATDLVIDKTITWQPKQ